MKKRVEEFISDAHPEVITQMRVLAEYFKENKVRPPIAIVAMEGLLRLLREKLQYEIVKEEDVPAHLRAHAHGGHEC